MASGVFKPTCRQRFSACHSLILNIYSDAKYVLTGETLRFRKFVQHTRLGLVNCFKDRKFDSTQEDTQPVTIDLTKQEVAMTIEALPAATPPKELYLTSC